MTHSELLSIINEEIELCEPDCHSHDADNQPWLALRAVVELHSPYTPVEFKDDIQQCFTCSFVYPCQTIQAIEKELL